MNNTEQVGWAYWLNDHWHLCADEPIAHGQQRPVYIETNETTYSEIHFLSELLEHWLPLLQYDDWSEYMQALWKTAQRSVSVGNRNLGMHCAKEFLDNFSVAFADQWVDWWREEDCLEKITRAQTQYDNTISYWRKRAVQFNEAEQVEALIATLPEWIKYQEDNNENINASQWESPNS